MATHSLTDEWSAPIAVESGDVLQNQGATDIYVSPGAADLVEAIRMPGHNSALMIKTATSIVARTVSGDAVLHVIKGL